MRYDEVRSVIAGSDFSEWNGIHCWGAGAGPSFLTDWSKSQWSDGWELHSRGHSHVAAFKNDVALTLAWGMDLYSEPTREMTPDWLANFAAVDGVNYYLVDTFWNGALIDRGYYTSIDAEAYLPLPSPVYGQEDGQGLPTLERHEVTAYDVALTRLINKLANHGDADYQRILNKSGFTIVD